MPAGHATSKAAPTETPPPLGRGEIAAARERLDQRTLVLVGLMGAGKSAIGRRVANRLGLAFFDADTEIERAAGMSIPEIFSRHGEAHFRDGEARVIARLMRDGQKVLATGGGAFMSETVRADAAAHGITVWLKADLPLLVRRVKRRDNRPLLIGKDPYDVLGKLIEERHPFYAQADITVQSRDVAHETMVAEVIRALAAWPDDHTAVFQRGDSVGRHEEPR